MAKGMYVGVDSVARKVKSCYIGVDGVARKVKKAYIGVNGVARLFYNFSPLGTLCYVGIKNNTACVVLTDDFLSTTQTYTIPNTIVDTSNYNNYNIAKFHDYYYISCKDSSNSNYKIVKTKDFVSYSTVVTDSSRVYDTDMMRKVGNNVTLFSPYCWEYVSTDKGETFNSSSFKYYTIHQTADSNYLYTLLYSDTSYISFRRVDVATGAANVIGYDFSWTNTTYGNVTAECASDNMVLFFTDYSYVLKFTNQGNSYQWINTNIFNSSNYVKKAAYFNGYYYALTSTAKLYRSNDGASWTLLNDWNTSNIINYNMYTSNNVLYVTLFTSSADYNISDDKTYIYYSSDGNTFTPIQMNECVKTIISV